MTSILNRPLLIGGVLVLALVAASLVSLGGGDNTRTVAASFPRAVSVYEGTDVRVLGVSIGTVTGVVPEGNSVRVEMEYDDGFKLPADAKAVVVTPTLVADRFVQLTPAYVDGPVLADGAEIALPDTGVPVELDRIYASLRDLSAALGPNGANSDGTLNHLLDASARTLDGKGKLANRTIRDLSRVAQTFGEGSGELFATVRQLARFTTTLADNDRLVRAFLADLAGLSGDLVGERRELELALGEVARSVGTVERFVRSNRKALVRDVDKLGRTMRTVANQKKYLGMALRSGPLGLGNLALAYNEKTASIGSRIGVQGNLADLDGFLCSIVSQSQLPRASQKLACALFERILEQGGGGNSPLPDLPGLPELPLPLPRAKPGDGGSADLGEGYTAERSFESLVGGGR